MIRAGDSEGGSQLLRHGRSRPPSGGTTPLAPSGYPALTVRHGMATSQICMHSGRFPVWLELSSLLNRKTH
jgi:hypothetical protein